MLRHSFASHLRSSEDLRAVQELLGQHHHHAGLHRLDFQHLAQVYDKACAGKSPEAQA
jgi:site-specific recombinase XerC